MDISLDLTFITQYKTWQPYFSISLISDLVEQVIDRVWRHKSREISHTVRFQHVIGWFIIPPVKRSLGGVYRNQSVCPSVCLSVCPLFLSAQLLLNPLMDFHKTLHKGSTQYVDVQEAINFSSALFKGRLFNFNVFLLLQLYATLSAQLLLNHEMDFHETLHKGSTQYVVVQEAISFWSAPFKGR